MSGPTPEHLLTLSKMPSKRQVYLFAGLRRRTGPPALATVLTVAPVVRTGR